jgi:hypothetical protein
MGLCSTVDLGEQERARRRTVDEPLEPRGTTWWQSASGKAVQHTVYSLIGCPAPRAARYVLVGIDDEGRRSILAVGRTHSRSPTLNLARIRHEGAQLGAREVHLSDWDDETVVGELPSASDLAG